MATFNKGDRVVKARAWTVDRYCRLGGAESAVPLGTKGTVIDASPGIVYVKFDSGDEWQLDPCELDMLEDAIGFGCLGDEDIVVHSKVESVSNGMCGMVKGVENADHATLFVEWSDGIEEEIPRSHLRLLTTVAQAQERNHETMMNGTVAKLFAKDTTENACLVDKHIGGQIATNEVGFIILDGKQKELLDLAKEKEADEKARLAKQ